MNEDRILQRYALACIFYATYDVPTVYSQTVGFSGGWFKDDGWLTNSNECSWHGVLCNSSGRVQAIRLDSNGLSGSFPSEVTLVKETLVELDVTDNKLFNEGVSWVGDLLNLEALLLGSNAIVEEGLPANWKFLAKLRSMDVSYCLFHGAIADDFFETFPDLEYLDIGGNMFNGSIPSTIASLWSLKFLYMEYTDLQGSLNPILKSGLPAIEEIWCDDNPDLNGAIAPEVGQLTTLKSLSLVNCNLSGVIPKTMGNLVNMEQLWLTQNNLNGNIPTELGALSRMELFYAHNNDLQGSMPSAVCSSTSLKKLGGDCNVCQGPCCTCCGNQCTNI